MALRSYSISELIASAKAIARGIPGIGTELGKDLELSINAAARLLQGVQVGATHAYQQLVPSSADAQRRDDLADELGLTFEKAATPARGLLALTYTIDTVGSFKVPAGAEITFPGNLFPDGQERTYRLLEDVLHRPYELPDVQFADGSGVHKVLPKSPDGVSEIFDRALLVLETDAGNSVSYAAVQSSNVDDQSFDLSTPVQSDVDTTSSNRLAAFVNDAIVAAECTVAGVIGNAPRVISQQDDFATITVEGAPTTVDLVAMIVEAGGGGEAVGAIDGNAERVTRLLEDTIACPPSHGNLQHWRELARACPDVDLDDAVVYQHARGQGSIDVVAIGRSGSVESSAFPGAHLEYAFGGCNHRRIGEVQAARVEAWLRSQAGYFEDIRVRSVEWDWRGNYMPSSSAESFLQSGNALFVGVTPFDGYGPDQRESLIYTSFTRHRTNLYPNGAGQIADSIESGQRVWVTVGPSTGDHRHAFATVVTTVLTVSRDRSHCTVADVSQLCPGLSAMYGGELVAWRWGSAGPLTQPVLDAVFAYFDQLGPGSYLESPHGPNYISKYHTSGMAPPQPGHGVLRWPPEGRRWSSPVRDSEIRERILRIEGVRQADVKLLDGPSVLGSIVDFEPAPFRTLALAGVVVNY